MLIRMAGIVNIRKTKNYRERREIDLTKSKQLLRFDIENVKFIADYFLVEHVENRGGGLSTYQKMTIFLRYLSDPGYQSGVAEDMGVDRTTVCKTISYVTEEIIKKSHEWIKFPGTQGELAEAVVKWQTRFKIPTVIGALDCTHVEILKPKHFGDNYVNRKGYPSINIQATCDADEKFTSLDVQWPGSTHDSRIWKRSEVCQKLARFKGSASLLGDSGYGLTPWLLTPYKKPSRDEELNFNKIHSKERVIIERCFGQIKKRFPILGNRIRVATEKVPKIVICCAVLHNIGKELNDVYEIEEDVGDISSYEDEYYEVEEDGDRQLRIRGQNKRAEIAILLNTNN